MIPLPDRATTLRSFGWPTCRILDAMVWLETGRVPMPWHRTLVAYASDHLPRSGAFKACVMKLKDHEMISYRDGGLVLEHEGRKLADPPVGIFTRDAYLERLSGKLGPVERLMCAELAALLGGSLPRASLAIAIGRESGSREFRNAMAKLLGVELVHVEGGSYSATLQLCPLSVFEIRELRASASEKP